MSLDRFVRWGPPPEWGPPTIDKLAAVARDFLGSRWRVTVEPPWISCECDDPQTYPLKSELSDKAALAADMAKFTRGFEVFHDPESHTSVLTRQTDDFTGALADRYAAIVAKWWNGEVAS